MRDKLVRKLIDLKNQRAKHWAAALTALEGNDQAAYDAAMAKVDDIDAEIAKNQELLDKYQPPEPDTVAGNTPGGEHKIRCVQARRILLHRPKHQIPLSL